MAEASEHADMVLAGEWQPVSDSDFDPDFDLDSAECCH